MNFYFFCENKNSHYICIVIKLSFQRLFDYTEELRDRAQRNSGNLLFVNSKTGKVPIPGRKRNYNKTQEL